MSVSAQFQDIALDEILPLAARAAGNGWRFVQMFATAAIEGIDLTYTFVHGDVLDNYRVRGVAKDDAVPSVTGHFLSAFVFENEAHDLFGANIENIAIDFGGKFYALDTEAPMTILSPEKIAEREKQAKIAAAKAAKAAKEAAAKAQAATAAEQKESENE